MERSCRCWTPSRRLAYLPLCARRTAHPPCHTLPKSERFLAISVSALLLLLCTIHVLRHKAGCKRGLCVACIRCMLPPSTTTCACIAHVHGLSFRAITGVKWECTYTPILRMRYDRWGVVECTRMCFRDDWEYYSMTGIARVICIGNETLFFRSHPHRSPLSIHTTVQRKLPSRAWTK